MAFKLPESFDGLSLEDVDALADAALDAINDMKLGEESSNEDLEAAELIAADLETIRAHRGEMVEASQLRADRIAKLAEVSEKPATEEAEAVAEEAPADEPELVEAAAEVLTPDAVIEADGEVVEEKQEAVAASSAPSPVQRAAASAPAVEVPAATPQVSLTAAADVPGLPNGAELDGLDGAVQAVLSRVKGMPKHNLATEAGGVYQRFGAAVIQRKNFGEGLVQSTQGADDFSLVMRAGDESRLEGGSLVAAAGTPSKGWCSPSETLYDLCQYETLEGMLDVPEFQVRRGGINFTPGPDFSDIYDSAAFWHMSEAEAIAGKKKTCDMVECPDWEEIRLDIIGMCVKSSILTEHTYPELVRRFMEGVLVAQQHKKNAWAISQMVAAASWVTISDDGRTIFNLDGLELYAMGMRYKYRLSQTHTMELAIPYWLKPLIRMDMARANGCCDHNISDAQIDAWFSARHFKPHWIYDYQDLGGTGSTPAAYKPIGDDGIPEIPDSVSILMYPAGTWARGVTDIISLDTVYDAASLEDNVYTSLFVEEGALMVQRCLMTAELQFNICSNGKGVADDIDRCANKLAMAPATAAGPPASP